jgi:glycosyltransferase involved in cell wall biosynthesis
LIIAGNWTREYRSHFFSMLGSASHQVIEVGFIPDAQMPTYYSLADVYVSPSLLEGFGLPLAESLACETPVVAADAGAAAEVIGPGGLLVPPADPAALAQAVSSLLGDQDRRRGMGLRGREHIEREFGSALMLEKLLQAYERFR